MPAKVSPLIFLYMFVGGALGASARYGIELTVQNFEAKDLILTTIVNLLGATALGFVNSDSFFQSIGKKMFFGHGFLGGFTTMSGLALITGGRDYGLGPAGLWFWAFALTQLLLGVLVYQAGLWLGRLRARA